MASLTSIREALAENLSSVPGLQCTGYLLGNPTPPTAEITPAEVAYDRAFARGMDMWMLTVRVFVGVTSDKGAQKRLDRMLASSGTDSVKAALESDTTLGGACDDLRVTRCSGYRQWGREGAALLGAEWTVEVIADGD